MTNRRMRKIHRRPQGPPPFWRIESPNWRVWWPNSPSESALWKAWSKLTDKTWQLIKAIAACIQSDRKIQEAEGKVFETILGRLNVEEKADALKLLKEPQVLQPGKLRAAFPSMEERGRVLQTVVSVALADGKLHFDEVAYLGELLTALEMSYQELAALNPEL